MILGLDIGGTKVKAGIVEAAPAGPSDTILLSETIPTPRAEPAAFYDAIADLVRRLRSRAEGSERSLVPLITVAHPGRFRPDGTLARGTTPNLGLSPGQFDSLSPAEELSRRLGCRVFVENDAIAQMRYGLVLLLRDPPARPHLLGERVIYLGPGTGFGGGVARVSRSGEIHPVTDGHFFDLHIPGYGDGTLTAEELLTGPAIAREFAPADAPQLDRLLSRPGDPSPERVRAEQIAAELGGRLALLIETIRAGRIVKVPDEPDRAWPEADRAMVRGVKRVLLGGSVGCSVGLGGSLRAHALERLRERGAAEVMIFQSQAGSADAGLLGAIYGLPRRWLTDE